MMMMCLSATFIIVFQVESAYCTTTCYPRWQMLLNDLAYIILTLIINRTHKTSTTSRHTAGMVRRMSNFEIILLATNATGWSFAERKRTERNSSSSTDDDGWWWWMNNTGNNRPARPFSTPVTCSLLYSHARIGTNWLSRLTRLLSPSHEDDFHLLKAFCTDWLSW
jgi:hypothetical protein